VAEAGRVGFVSLGCAKALVDSEEILTGLTALGYHTVPDYASADVVVVNTCGFIESAVTESLETIAEALQGNGRVVVTGCLGADAERLRARFPELLAVTGPQQADAVIAAVQAARPARAPLTAEPLLGPAGIKLTPPHYAYLKIAEGCNHRCSFCIIPTMRGRLRSRRIDSVLAEADRLAAAGVQEVLVVAQDTSAYGLDLRYASATVGGRELRSDLPTLCRELAERIPWVRLHYVYPYPHADRLVPLMAEGRLLPYLDVPLQHAHPDILRAMRRPAAVEDTLERLRRWRELCPDLSLRSTFIVGFPGEGEAEFETLLEFLEAAELDRVGCFSYSAVEGAAANALPGRVPEEVAEERRATLMARQAAISARRRQRWIGRDVEVLVDAAGEEGALARTPGDAPEVDGVVHVQPPVRLKAGDRTWVRILDADEHDLYAAELGNPVKLH